MRKESVLRLEKAEQRVLEQILRTSVETLPLFEALGLVTSRGIRAPRAIPHFPMSTVDGYAIRSPASRRATTAKPVRLDVVGTVRAGGPAATAVRGHEAVRIMTGARLPPGADCVVRLEDCRPSAGRVAVLGAAAPGDNVRAEGSNRKKGERVIPAGKVLRAIDVEVLAAMGVREVSVHRRPSVAVVSTGDELVPIDGRIEDGKIVQSSGYLVAARAREAGAGHRIFPPVKDRPAAIRDAIRAALDADLVVVTGGTSRGDCDHVRAVLRGMGTVHLEGVAVRPGGTFAFATVAGRPVFSLPGNPSACLVLFELFIRPSISKMLGRSRLTNDPIRAESLSRFPRPSASRRYVGVVMRSLGGRRYVSADEARSPGTLVPMIGHNGLAVVHADSARVCPTDMVDVLPLYPDDIEDIGCELSLPKGFPSRTRVPVVSFVGKSGSGKTTLLEKVIKELVGRGYRIGSVKHDAHNFEIDTPGKDSFRHRAAGARIAAISSPGQVAVIESVTSSRSLDEVVGRFGDAVDVVLTEGFKRSGKPKVEVCRGARSRELICSSDELLAIASDVKFDMDVPQYGLDDSAGVADLIEDRFLRPRP